MKCRERFVVLSQGSKLCLANKENQKLPNLNWLCLNLSHNWWYLNV